MAMHILTDLQWNILDTSTRVKLDDLAQKIVQDEAQLERASTCSGWVFKLAVMTSALYVIGVVAAHSLASGILATAVGGIAMGIIAIKFVVINGELAQQTQKLADAKANYIYETAMAFIDKRIKLYHSTVSEEKDTFYITGNMRHPNTSYIGRHQFSHETSTALETIDVVATLALKEIYALCPFNGRLMPYTFQKYQGSISIFKDITDVAFQASLRKPLEELAKVSEYTAEVKTPAEQHYVNMVRLTAGNIHLILSHYQSYGLRYCQRVG